MSPKSMKNLTDLDKPKFSKVDKTSLYLSLIKKIYSVVQFIISKSLLYHHIVYNIIHHPILYLTFNMYCVCTVKFEGW